MSSHFLTYRLGKGIPGGGNRMSQGKAWRPGVAMVGGLMLGRLFGILP